MSEESLWPRNWRAAAPFVIWLGLILAAGTEAVGAFVQALIHGGEEWLRFFVSAIVMVALMAAALFQWRQWASRANPNWVIGAATALIIAVALLPYFEQGRLPYDWAFQSESPAVEAAPSEPQQPDRQLEIARLTKEVADLNTANATAEQTIVALRQENKQLRQQVVTVQQKLSQADAIISEADRATLSRTPILHMNDLDQWRFIKALRDASLVNPPCRASWVIGGGNAANLQNELRPLLHYAGWFLPGAPSQAKLPAPSGVTIIVGSESENPNSVVCGELLAELLQNMDIVEPSLRKNQTNEYLKECNFECIEILVGDPG